MQAIPHFNKEQTLLRKRRILYEQHIDQSNRAGAQPQLAGH
jgi:hypothetical protein